MIIRRRGAKMSPSFRISDAVPPPFLLPFFSFLPFRRQCPFLKMRSRRRRSHSFAFIRLTPWMSVMMDLNGTKRRERAPSLPDSGNPSSRCTRAFTFSTTSCALSDSARASSSPSTSTRSSTPSKGVQDCRGNGAWRRWCSWRTCAVPSPPWDSVFRSRAERRGCRYSRPRLNGERGPPCGIITRLWYFRRIHHHRLGSIILIGSSSCGNPADHSYLFTFQHALMSIN